MPGYDGTGPRGMGPMTGGGRGFCAVPATGNTLRPRAGRVFGRGAGRGRRNVYYATGMPFWQRATYGNPYYGYSAYPEPSAEEEKEMLKSEAETLRQELEDIQDRISVLEKEQNRETTK
jgi:hypothetical protein